jgi:fatty acid desaturase
VLCQLSYAPGSAVDCIGGSRGYPQRVAAPSQRRALGALFTVLAAVLAAIAAAALIGAGGSAARWVIAVAALALAGWLGSLALSSFRHR